MEEWKQIKGYEGVYEVSNFGNVRSMIFRNKQSVIFRTKILKLKTHTQGYKQVILYKNNKDKTVFVHRLVYEAFIGFKDNKMDINHINGIKDDNKIENLEECTRSYNILHSYKVLNRKLPMTMLGRKGKDNPSSKKIIQLSLNGEFIKIFDSITLAGESVGITRSTISAVLRMKRGTAGGYIWKYFTDVMD